MRPEDLIRSLDRHLPDGVLIVETGSPEPCNARVVWCNDAVLKLVGCARKDMIDRSWQTLLAEETVDATRETICRALGAAHFERVDLCFARTGGGVVWCDVEFSPVKGEPHLWLFVLRDISARRERECELAAQVASLTRPLSGIGPRIEDAPDLAAIAEHTHDLVTLTDLDFRIRWANPAFLSRSGYDLQSILGCSHCELLAKKAINYDSRESAIKAILNGEYRPGKACNWDRQGRAYWTDIRVCSLRDARGRPSGFLVTERDISKEWASGLELERAREALDHASQHDKLTGLLDRVGLEVAVAKLGRSESDLLCHAAILYVDLDRFRLINDGLGHSAGDDVLIDAASRIRMALDEDDVAARIGVDEFIILRHRARGEDSAETMRFAERLSESLNGRTGSGEHGLSWSASIGVALCGEEPRSYAELALEAELALCEAKRVHGRAVLFSDKLGTEQASQRQLAIGLVRAIERREIKPHYQIQVDAETREIRGLEALARWYHPEHGILTPDLFMPIAEARKLSDGIDRTMLDQAIEDLRRWERNGIYIPHVSVNVSTLRLHDPGLLDELRPIAFEPGRIVFELVESTFLDQSAPELQRNIEGLRDLGIGLEIDDFGTGHASIAGLLRVRPDRLKIDRGLVGPIVAHPDQRRLIELIVEIARTIGIEVTAEGIETEEHAAIARDLGCTVLQGFLFSRPEPADAIDAIARASTPRRAGAGKTTGRKRYDKVKAEIGSIEGSRASRSQASKRPPANLPVG